MSLANKANLSLSLPTDRPYIRASTSAARTMRIAILSDTHGYLDPRLASAFEDVDPITPAGDIGGQHILDALSAIAPVHAVYGNNDEKRDTLGLPLRTDVDLAGVRFHLVHQLPHAAPAPGTHAVVFGHSHRTLIEERGGVLYLNPGAAGRAGFHRIQTVAILEITRAKITEARILDLGPREPREPRARTK